MIAQTQKHLIGLIQMCSTANKATNLQFIQDNVEKASKAGVKMCFLPEGFFTIASSQEELFQNIEAIQGNYITSLKNLAKQNKMWLSLGGFQELVENNDKINNTHLIISEEGEIVAKYNKLHLFDIQIDEKNTIRESSKCQFGQEFAPVVQSPVGNLGLTICYDLRFPEVYRQLAQQGADILLVPSAFFKLTGSYHWHTLLKARAIENQCFVIAAAQFGKHNQKRESYGHSIVIDPWGDVLLDMQEELGLGIIEINLGRIEEVRKKLPSFYHNRMEATYKLNEMPKY